MSLRQLGLWKMSRCQAQALPSTDSYTSKAFIFSIRRDMKFQTLDSLFQFQIVKLLMLHLPANLFGESSKCMKRENRILPKWAP